MQIIGFIIFQLIGILLIPLFDAIIKNTKALLQGRKGPPITQTYYDFIKLIFYKQLYISKFTSTISIIGPIIILATSIMFFFFIPIISSWFNLNLIFLFYFVSFGSFWLVIYAMDNATYFGGLGAARELFLLAMIEPVLIIMIGILGIFFHTINIIDIHNSILNGLYSPYIGFVIILLAIVLWYIILGENKRFPFDNPATHLELTMIHEAMLLETSGPQLGMMELASKINLIGFMNLFVYIFLPFNLEYQNYFILFIIWFIKLLLLCICLGAWEIFVVKKRIFKYQNIYFALLMIQLFVIIIYFLR